MKKPFPYLALAVLGAFDALARPVQLGPISQVNPPSNFAIDVDGQFNAGAINLGPPPSLLPATEWSDVTPLAFISPPLDNGPLLSVPLGTPGVNSLLYAAVAPGTTAVEHELYLMYDYLPRTNPNFGAGEFIADIKFPLTINGVKSPDAVVQFRGNGVASPTSFFDVFVDLDGQGPTSPVPAASLGIDEAAVGFGPSTLSAIPHMLIELEATLAIPPGFSSGFFPPGGSPGVYSPEPAFWAGSAANDLVDPPISAAIFTINPDGSTLVVAAVPEMGSGLIKLLGATSLLAAHAWRRRKSI